jgi:hypothetical protein
MEELVLVVGSTQVHLSGAGIVAPVKGCRRNQPKEAGENVVEHLDVVLHGLPTVVDDWLKMIEGLFSRVTLGEQATLTLKAATGLASYESKVVGGRVELLGRGSMDLKRGGLGVAVYVERLNYWEGDAVAVPLSNPHGTDVTTGLVLDNQYSPASGKVNYALIAGGVIEGEIPAPAMVKIKHDDLVLTDWLANIIVSQDVVYNLQVGDHWIEGGAANSVWNFGAVMNSGASCGAYGLVQWTIPDPTQLLSWVIEDDRAARFAGKLVQPVMRLHTAVTTDDYWMRSKVKQGEAVEYSRWQKLTPYSKIQILPAVHIPPRDLKSAEMFGVVFAVEVQRNVAGTNSMAIDDIDLLPVDGFRHYFNLGDGGLSPNELLVDELGEGLIYSVGGDATLRKLTHQATGKGIWLVPGEDQCIRIKFDDLSGNCNPNQHVALQLSYRQRRKNL